MVSIDFVYNRIPGKLQEFLTKLQSVGTPDKIVVTYPASIGFGSSHARGFPAVLKYAGLLDPSGSPTDAYKKGLRGGTPGRELVGAAIRKAYQPMFAVYPDAPTQADTDLVTFVKSNSSLDDEKAALVVKTFKVLCKFADFSSSKTAGDDDSDDRTDDNSDEDSGDQGKVPVSGDAPSPVAESSSTSTSHCPSMQRVMLLSTTRSSLQWRSILAR